MNHELQSDYNNGFYTNEDTFPNLDKLRKAFKQMDEKIEGSLIFNQLCVSK